MDNQNNNVNNMANFIGGGFLKGKKTMLTAILSIISCVVAYLVGDISVVDLMQIVVPLFGVLFLGKNIQTEMGQQLEEINKKLLSKTKTNAGAKTKSDD